MDTSNHSPIKLCPIMSWERSVCGVGVRSPYLHVTLGLSQGQGFGEGFGEGPPRGDKSMGVTMGTVTLPHHQPWQALGGGPGQATLAC